MKINPVLKKELKLMGRTVKTSVIILFYNVILAGVSLYVFYEMLNSKKYTGAIDYSTMLQIYIIMAYIEFILLLLIVPSLTAGSIAGERERQTFDMLLVTNMKPWQIIIGKLETSLVMVLMLGISSLPIVSLVFVFGGIRMIELFMLIFMLSLEAMFIGSFGLLFSSLLKKTTIATVLTYATLLVLIGGSYLFVSFSHQILEWKLADPSETQVDIGNLVYILLINPAITFAGLISSQAGSNRLILNLCNSFGTYDDSFIVRHWISISVSLQSAITIVMLWIAKSSIQPFKRMKLRKKSIRNF